MLKRAKNSSNPDSSEIRIETHAIEQGRGRAKPSNPDSSEIRIETCVNLKQLKAVVASNPDSSEIRIETPRQHHCGIIWQRFKPRFQRNKD
jgi:hypothetical protein